MTQLGVVAELHLLRSPVLEPGAGSFGYSSFSYNRY
jgi:hypothetical protein